MNVFMLLPLPNRCLSVSVLTEGKLVCTVGRISEGNARGDGCKCNGNGVEVVLSVV